VQSAGFEETSSYSDAKQIDLQYIHSSVNEIQYYNITKTFVEKSVNAGHFPYSS